MFRRLGWPVWGYDPYADHFSGWLDFSVSSSAERAMEHANTVVIAKPWEEFLGLDFGKKFVLDLTGRIQ